MVTKVVIHLYAPQKKQKEAKYSFYRTDNAIFVKKDTILYSVRRPYSLVSNCYKPKPSACQCSFVVLRPGFNQVTLLWLDFLINRDSSSGLMTWKLSIIVKKRTATMNTFIRHKQQTQNNNTDKIQIK